MDGANTGSDDDHVMVYATWPDRDGAAAAARALVDQRLAACVVLVPGVTAIYRWQGVIEEASEVVVLAKTRATRAPAVMAALAAIHPYEVPALLVLPIAAAAHAYGAWITAETGEV